MYRRYNKVKRLKHYIGLYSKPVTFLKVYLNYNQCSINANLCSGCIYHHKCLVLYLVRTQFLDGNLLRTEPTVCIKPLHTIRIHWALIVIKINLKNLTGLLYGPMWCFNLLTLLWHLYFIIDFTLTVLATLVTLVEKKISWWWSCRIETCRSTIRRKSVNIKCCAFIGSIKVESIKMQATHIGAYIFMYTAWQQK